MTTSETKAQTESELPSAAEIRRIIDAKHHRQELEEAGRQQAEEAEAKHQEEMFFARRLTADFIALVMKRVHDAAESGASEIMLGRFPSAWCTDGGRKINVPEPDWPDTLQGFAREFFDFWELELKPRGFHLRTAIISFPGGMPGDVGAFLAWGE